MVLNCLMKYGLPPSEIKSSASSTARAASLPFDPNDYRVRIKHTVLNIVLKCTNELVNFNHVASTLTFGKEFISSKRD